MYISYRKKINNSAIGYTHQEYNHPMNPALFSYIIHRSHRCDYDKAVELARGLQEKFFIRKQRRFFKIMT